MKQVKLTEGKLLDNKGNLEESGYSTSLVREYDRESIKASKLRIKEWDYYYIGNKNYGVALTIADNSYMGLISVSWLDFKKKSQITKSIITFMPLGKTNLPSTSEIGNVSFRNKKIIMTFDNDGKSRRLYCNMKKFEEKNDFSCDIVLYDAPIDSMVIATPFNKPKHFYYNQKINCMKAVGKVNIGSKEYIFDNDSFGVLDWGRGVWTYKNTWYWSSLNSSIENGLKIGFNLGYGFGCNENATENMIFCNNKSYKVDEVVFEIPKNTKGDYDYLQKWIIKSNDGKVDLIFEPILDRFANTSAVIIKSIQHQVFGKFSGKLVCGSEEITIHELVGFAERVTNHW